MTKQTTIVVIGALRVKSSPHFERIQVLKKQIPVKKGSFLLKMPSSSFPCLCTFIDAFNVHD